MENMLISLVILSLSAISSNAYTCTNQDYTKDGPAWLELFHKYCERFTERNALEAINCIKAKNISYLESVNLCEDELERQRFESFYEYMMWVCTAKFQGNEEFVCCVADKIVQSGGSNKYNNRAAIYKACFDEYLKPPY